jgi:hypothetical protein
VQFGEIVGCKKGKDEELKGLKERAGDKVLQNMGTLLDSQALSDLKIKTSDGKVFQAHKSILAGLVCIFFSHHSHHSNRCLFIFIDCCVMVYLMELLLKHIYTGSVDKLDDLKVDVVLELLNASNKVKSSRISGTSPFEWIRSSSNNLFFALVMICTVRSSPAEGILRDDPRPILHC